MTTVEITITDLQDAREILGACLTYFQARDMAEAQYRIQPLRPSGLTSEVERLKTRYDSYMADLLLAERDAADEEEEEEDEEEDAVAVEEVLADAPLGEPVLPRQQGRRLTADEIRKNEAVAPGSDDLADE